MRYMTCKEFKKQLNGELGYDCISAVYLNEDRSICGVCIGDVYWELCDIIKEIPNMDIDTIRIINTWNLNNWKDLYGKKEENN